MIMKRFFILAQVGGMLLATATMLPAQATSSWVFNGPDNRLHYTTDGQGNRIMDFSSAGYQGGGVKLPSAPVRTIVTPSGGDDTSAIQAALDAVAVLPLDSDGFRGAVQLDPGTFNVSSTIKITASGVVLHGSGAGDGGTIINMTGPPFLFLSISGAGSWSTFGTAASLTDPYVPFGATSFDVNDASSFHAGDTILVRRPVTAAWVHLMGMDTLVRDGAPQTWISPGSTITTDRVVAAVSGNQITLDVPLTDSLDSQFVSPPGASVIKYTFAGRVSQVGIEGFAVIAHPQNVDITQPQYSGLTMGAVINSWIRDIVFQDTQNTIQISGTVKQTTFDNVSVKHTVAHSGDGPADFAFSGTQLLFNKCSVTGKGNTWPAVAQSRVTGPVALLNFFADDRGFDPHQRWATGLLCDNCNFPNSHTSDKSGVAFSDRGILGSGQGWDAGWSVAWNVTSTFFLIQQPPGANNFCIGCKGSILTEAQPGNTNPLIPNGIYDAFGQRVTPSSLYLQQLLERKGPQAVIDIGYLDYLKSIDSVAPVTTAVLSANPNAVGWNNSDVTVTLNSTDNESGAGTGVQQITYSMSGAQTAGPTVISGTSTSLTVSVEGITTITFFGSDFAGNAEASKTVVVRLDKSSPVITGSRAPAANANGWNNTDVTVGFACMDALSGLAPGSPPPPALLLFEGSNQQVGGVCGDLAGNLASTAVAGINIDKTAPTLTATFTPQPNVNGWNNSDVTVTFGAVDALSGVASVTGPVLVQSEGKGQAVPGAAVDLAGNASSLAVSVNLDKTPPEAFHQFDPVTHDLVLFGRDSLSGTVPGPIAPSSVVQLARHGEKDDDDDDRDSAVELLTYTVLDLAGNPLVLTERVSRREQSISVSVLSVQYGAGPQIVLPRNEESVEWQFRRDGSLRNLEQRFEAGSEQREQEVTANFDADDNQTIVRVESRRGRTTTPGLVLLRLATVNGQLVVEF